jgi:hypothetical protein
MKNERNQGRKEERKKEMLERTALGTKSGKTDRGPNLQINSTRRW